MVSLKLVLNGASYETRPMDPLLCMQDAGRIATMVGPAMDGFGGGLESFAKAAVSLLGQFKNQDFVDVVERLFSYATVGGKELGGTAWHVHFTGKMDELVSVLAWLLEAQFSSFFVGLRARAGALMNSPAEPAAT